MLHLECWLWNKRLFALRRHFLPRALPLLLAILVLLAQTLALTHREVHPNTGKRDVPTIAAVATGSALDLLFGHTNGAACDDFDAAFGLDINPGQCKPDMVAPDYASAASVALAQSNLLSHPPGLFLARAPPRA